VRLPVSRKHKSNKVSKSLVALGSAAVLTVYSAGYFRTRAAAERFADDTKKRLAPTVASGPSENLLVVPPPVRTAPPPTVPVPTATKRPEKKATPKLSAPPASTPPAPPPTTAATIQPEPVAPVQIPTPVPVPTPAPVPPPTPPPTPATPKSSPWKDGTYTGWGTSRHGDIQATVVIENGRIASATISQCLTRYSCSLVTPLLPQIVSRQSPETDYVSGATQSTNALYYAVVEALAKAK
jgi:uncharacterized protein with FMN-binding domain